MNDANIGDTLATELDKELTAYAKPHSVLLSPDTMGSQLLQSMQQNVDALTERRDQVVAGIKATQEKRYAIATSAIDTATAQIESAMAIVQQKSEQIKLVQEHINNEASTAETNIREVEAKFAQLIKSQEDAIAIMRQVKL